MVERSLGKLSAEDMKVISGLGQQAAKGFRSLAEGFGRFGYILRRVMWSAYRNDGAPYGETEEGLSRWIKENA